MKAVLISVQAEHNANIEKGLKTEELRTRVPKCELPIKFYTYESGKNGRHKVTNEWICREIREYPNPDSYPLSLVDRACVPFSYICDYAKDGEKFLRGLVISDLVIYDKPKKLSEFYLARHCFNYKNVDIVKNVMGDYVTQYFNNSLCRRCIYYDNGLNWCEKIDGKKAITRPPQSWCYVESEDTE